MPSPAEKKSTHRKTDSSGAKSQTDKRIKHNWSAIRREHIRGRCPAWDELPPVIRRG